MSITDVITDQILNQFKERMHLGDEEDDNLRRILSASFKVLQRLIPGTDLGDEEFKELVFERSRYVYNDALEYFNNNFSSNITSLQLAKALEEGDG